MDEYKYRRNTENHELGHLRVDEFLALSPTTITYEQALSFSFTVNSSHPRYFEVIRRVTELLERETSTDFLGSATLFAVK